MHRNLTRPLFAMLALILASLACMAGNVPAAIEVGQITCNLKGFLASNNTYYECTCPIDNKTELIRHAYLQEVSQQDLYTKVCGAAGYQLYVQEMSVAATATPTLVPTATSTPTKRPTATPAPYLSGDVTTCNLTDRYINFPIDPNAADISGLDFEVTIGGLPSTCNVPSSNAGILSCTFPQGQVFPAQIIVNVDGFITNNFTFDGGICASNPLPPSNDNNDDEPFPTEPPAPTEPPIDTGGD